MVTLPLPEPVTGSFAKHLSPEAYKVLVDAGVRQTYPAGTPLFHQGDPTRHVILIEDGWVKVTATSRRGWTAVLALRGPGDIVGEMSALDGRPRMATVATLTEATGVVILSDRLDACIVKEPSVALAISRHLANSLRESDRQRMQFGSSNGDGRLIVFLVDLMDRTGKPEPGGAVRIELGLSQQDLASSVGVSREVVARTMRVLRSRKTVQTGRRLIVVLQPDVLRALGRSVSMSTEAP